MKTALVVLLLVVAALGALAAAVVVWGAKNAADTQAFIELVDPVFDQPDVQEVLAEWAAVKIIETTQLQQRIEQSLDPKIRWMSGLMTQMAHEAIYGTTLKALNSETLRQTSLEKLHAQWMQLLRGDTQSLNDAGDVVLDLRQFLGQALAPLALPLAGTVLGQLNIPPEAGEYVLLTAERYDALQRWFDAIRKNFRQILAALGLTILISAGLALYLARTPRWALIGLGLILAALALLSMLALTTLQTGLSDPASERVVVAYAMADQLLGDLVRHLSWLIVLGLGLSLGTAWVWPQRKRASAG